MKAFNPILKQVKNVIMANFNAEYVAQPKGIVPKLVLGFDTGDELLQLIVIKIIKTESSKDLCGIHVHSLQNLSELSFHLPNAIERALDHGFETIYIHAK